jgi:type II secretory pathway pseudopilin PulG
VLIALVVIGVIAAITIPRLIANYRAEALYTQLMQANSIVQNGAKAMKLDNVDLDEIMSNRDYNQLFKYFKTGTCKTPANETKAKYYNYYGNRNAAGACASDLLYPVCLANGMMLWLGKLNNGTTNSTGTSWSDSGASIIAIDINGWGKKPDRYGKDVFFWVYSSKVDGLIPTGKSANIIASSSFYTKCPGSTGESEAGIGCTSTALADKDYFKKF